MRGHSHIGRCALGLAAGFACGQSQLAGQGIVHTAHPQESQQNGASNLTPLGIFATGQAAEARSQMLLRALELPGPGATLVGIEVLAQASSTLFYQSLRVTVSPTQAAALSAQFAGNLVQPVTVLQANGLNLTYAAGTWTAIPFTTPYVHDGVSALVLDIQKIISPTLVTQTAMETPAPPTRPDRPRMIYTFGSFGSGAATATTATLSGDPLCLRLLWQNAPTMTHRSDPGLSGNQYALGSTLSYSVTGTPGSFYISAFDTNLLPAPAVIPGVLGRLWLFGSYDHLGLLDASGLAVHAVAIPAQAAFVGVYVVYQAGVLDAGTGVGMLTNAHDHFVNP